MAMNIFRLAPERSASRQAASEGDKEWNLDINQRLGNACFEVLD
jgi:hypothetical protein